MNNHQKAYQQFFLKSEAGKYFVDILEKLINSNHEKAEDTPEHARDLTQRAKGAREILAHINSVSAERNIKK